MDDFVQSRRRPTASTRCLGATYQTSDFLITRLNSDGSLDNGAAGDADQSNYFGSINTKGYLQTDFSTGQTGDSGGAIASTDLNFTLALENNPSDFNSLKLVAAGSANVNNNGNSDFAIARYDLNGIPDTNTNTGFGPLQYNSATAPRTGKVTIDFAGGNDIAYASGIDAAGNILLAGVATAGTAAGTGSDFALARLDRTGTLDPTFGNAGKLTTDFGAGGTGAAVSTDVARSMTLMPDGRIVLAGYAQVGSNVQIALARYQPSNKVTVLKVTAPVVTAVPIQGTAGAEFDGVVARFTGSVVGSALNDYSVNITWADGLVDSTNSNNNTASSRPVHVVDNGDNTFTVFGSHWFDSIGNTSATVSVSYSASGTPPGSAPIPIHVSPKVTATGSRTAGGGYHINVGFSTGPTTSTAFPDYWSIDWGDGTVTRSDVDPYGFIGHNYPNGIATYQVVATATYQGNSTSAQPITVSTTSYVEDFENTNPTPLWHGSSVITDDANPAHHFLGLFSNGGRASLDLPTGSPHVGGTLSFEVIFVGKRWDGIPFDLPGLSVTNIEKAISDVAVTIDGVSITPRAEVAYHLPDSGYFFSNDLLPQPYSLSPRASLDIAFTCDFADTGSAVSVGVAISGLLDGENAAFDNAVMQLTPPPEVSVITMGTANEANANGASFYFARSGDLGNPLTVSYKIDSNLPNAAKSGVNYVALPVTVTIPAGESGIQVPLTTIDDKVPGWTKEVKVDLLDGGATYSIQPNATTATVSIVDSDLSIKLGDDSANQVLQGSPDGRQNLVEVDLGAPTTINKNAAIALAISGNVNVWSSASPAATDSPILSSAKRTILWRQGVDVVPQKLWVGAVGGSSSVGDIVLALADNESSADRVPSAPTANAAATKQASAVAITLTPKNDPNAFGGTDWTNQLQSWLVGQFVDIQASLSGPPELKVGATYSWTVPGGYGATGSPLRDYQIGPDWAHSIALKPDDGGSVSGDILNVNTGTSLPRVAFFWPSGAGAQLVSVTISNVGTTSKTLSAKTTFNLGSPNSSFKVFSLGNAGLSSKNNMVGLFNAPGDPLANPDTVGIISRGKVSQPETPSLAALSGQWSVFQLVNPAYMVRSLDGTAHYAAIPSMWGIDSSAIYGMNVGQPSLWPTSQSYYDTTDAPAYKTLDAFKAISEATSAAQFLTYQMYLPPDPNGRSRWVPLNRIDWQFHARCFIAHPNGANTPGVPSADVNNGQTATEVAGPMTVPTWDFLWTGANINPV